MDVVKRVVVGGVVGKHFGDHEVAFVGQALQVLQVLLEIVVLVPYAASEGHRQQHRTTKPHVAPALLEDEHVGLVHEIFEGGLAAEHKHKPIGVSVGTSIVLHGAGRNVEGFACFLLARVAGAAPKHLHQLLH